MNKRTRVAKPKKTHVGKGTRAKENSKIVKTKVVSFGFQCLS
jgi:hypothetical protein